MTEHFKAPEKIQLSKEEIANLLDVQFKTLVIKILTELVEFVRKLDEKMKPMLRETKENVQGTNSEAKEIDFQEVQEARRVPKKLDPRRNTPRHIIITLPKMKQERILEAAREKETVTYNGLPIRLSAYFSTETLQARRGWQEVFQVMKGKDLHPRLLYPAKLSFRMEGKIKCFSDKVKLKKFIITKPLLYEMLKGLT